MEKGKELFWKYGFKRVTVEEICKEANVSKMTFYKYFSNKTDLIKAIMERVIDYSVKTFKEIMARDIPFSEKVKLQIQMKMEGTIDISKEMLNDMIIHADPEIQEFFGKMRAETTSMIYNSYLEAQKNGHIRSDMKPEFIMYFMQHMFVMMEDENLLAIYNSTSELATEMIKFFFYGILGAKEQE